MGRVRRKKREGGGEQGGLNCWSSHVRRGLLPRTSTRARVHSAATVAPVIVIATILFLDGRVKNSRSFLRSYRLIRGSARRVVEGGNGFSSIGEAADAVHAFNMSGLYFLY